jgi:stage II sporulation protein R
MKKFEISIIIGLVITIILSSFTGFAKECDGIRKSVLRLHILANSNSVADQELKIKVRDKILANTDKLFVEQNSLENAKKNVSQRLDEIKKIASDEISANGYDYKVNVEIVNMFFDTRVYDELTMPAGRYDALRVTIGKAEGKNWWCVLYPPICLPAATKKVDMSKALNEKQIKIVGTKKKYEVRFKAVEIYQKIKSMVK